MQDNYLVGLQFSLVVVTRIECYKDMQEAIELHSLVTDGSSSMKTLHSHSIHLSTYRVIHTNMYIYIYSI